MPEVFPCLPDDLFVVQNRDTINALIERIGMDFPYSGASEINPIEGNEIEPAIMDWMWTRLMGVQHGSMEGWGDKVRLYPRYDVAYQDLVDQLHYGSFSFVQPKPPEHDHANLGLVLGGMPHEITSRIMGLVSGEPGTADIDDIVVLAGQRLRWDVPSESTTTSIYDAIVRTLSDARVSELRDTSPLVKQQEGIAEVGGWSRPFATEYEMARLCVEAVFYDQINWHQYNVDTIWDTDGQDIVYTINGKERFVPAREEKQASYQLKDGRRVHVLNAKAKVRTQGIPRPTSDSQTREVLDVVAIDEGASVLIATGLPHVRAGLDVVTRLANLALPKLGEVSITTSPWLQDKELIAALGEIPATHKADLRLRAALAGEDPDAKELVCL